MIMSKIGLFLSLLLFAGISLLHATDPVVSNVTAAQRTDGSKIVDIWYDLEFTYVDSVFVSLDISEDGGASFLFEPTAANLNGDIGFVTVPGNGKHIVWDMEAENRSFDSANFVFKTTAVATVANVTFNPPGGSYQTVQNITLSTSNPEATIRYTTDGSDPTEASPIYSNPIIIPLNTPALTIKARAFCTGWDASNITQATYTINIFVEGGTFHNGTSNVTLSSFYIEKYEVTQSGYQAVMGTNPSSFPGNPNRPVERVSWFKAIEYCNLRSMQEGLTPCYSYSSYGTNPANWPAGWYTSSHNQANVSCNWSAIGYRLPTEMEWMFAAKGGNGSQGYTYSGSNTIDNVARYSLNSDGRTWDVGGLAANELGTFDMSGNVWEWVWDNHENTYPTGDQTNPTGPQGGDRRVRRGGGWNTDANYCTVSFRSHSIATYSLNVIGFRCVRVSP